MLISHEDDKQVSVNSYGRGLKTRHHVCFLQILLMACSETLLMIYGDLYKGASRFVSL